MRVLAEIGALLYKEFLVEWKQRYAINGLLLYVAGTVFIVSLIFRETMNAQVWLTTFWLLNMFLAVNAVAKSFMGESEGQMLYVYQLASATAIISAKIIYNVLLMTTLTLASLALYVGFLGAPTEHIGLFTIVAIIGAIGLAVALTLVSALTAQAGNKNTLMTLLSLPVVLPQLIFILRLSEKTTLGILPDKDLLYALALTGVNVLLSLLLFPYLWRQ